MKLRQLRFLEKLGNRLWAGCGRLGADEAAEAMLALRVAVHADGHVHDRAVFFIALTKDS